MDWSKEIAETEEMRKAQARLVNSIHTGPQEKIIHQKKLDRIDSSIAILKEFNTSSKNVKPA